MYGENLQPPPITPSFTAPPFSSNTSNSSKKILFPFLLTSIPGGAEMFSQFLTEKRSLQEVENENNKKTYFFQSPHPPSAWYSRLWSFRCQYHEIWGPFLTMAPVSEPVISQFSNISFRLSCIHREFPYSRTLLQWHNILYSTDWGPVTVTILQKTPAV